MSRTLAVLTVAAILVSAPSAFAMGGGGKYGRTSGVYQGTSTSGVISGRFDDGTYRGGYSNGYFGGTYTVSAPEPCAAFAVGLGLVGARLLRRRT